MTFPQAGVRLCLSLIHIFLTIGFKKTASELSKYAQIEVNGERTYETLIARTSGWSNTGRQQVYIDLDAGENTIKIFNPIDGQKADSIRRYSKMGNALKEAKMCIRDSFTAVQCIKRGSGPFDFNRN